MTNWIKLIEDNRDELIEAGIQAYTDAWESRNLRFMVEIDEDGKVFSWFDLPGGNNFHMDTYKVIEFCAEYWEIPDGENEQEYIKADVEEHAAVVVEMQIGLSIEEVKELMLLVEQPYSA